MKHENMTNYEEMAAELVVIKAGRRENSEKKGSDASK